MPSAKVGINPELFNGDGTPRIAPNDPGTGRQPTAKVLKGAPVTTQHPLYTKMLDKWQRCRDVIEGEDAIHEAGERYIAKLRDQQANEYSAMVNRTPFYNATWRTIAGLLGMLFRKLPKIEAPNALLDYFKDVTMSGVPLSLFAYKVAEEALSVGRVGVLTEYPPVNVVGITQLDADRLNLRPKLALYLAESIINWRVQTINNKPILTMVVLKEEYCEPINDFQESVEPRYRVLDLVPYRDSNTGATSLRYRQRVFKVNRSGKQEQVSGDLYPLIKNAPLSYIPFVFIGVDDTTPEVDDPPLIDLVNMNIAHYKVACDYETGCHFCGLPTPVVAGQPLKPGDKLYVGSMTAWMLTDPASKWGYLEFGGQGLGALVQNMEKKEQYMVVLGARMLEEMKKGVEAAETAALHRAGEQSVLAGMAQIISMGLTSSIKWFADWAMIDSSAVTIDINKDFVPAPLDPIALAQLVSSWQQGAISYETLFDNIKRMGVIPDDRKVEDEFGMIAANPPTSVMDALLPDAQPATNS